MVPVDHVVAIYARENGQGMAFPVPTGAPAGEGTAAGAAEAGPGEPTAGRGLRLASTETAAPPAVEEPPAAPEPPPPGGPRPSLKRIK